MEAEDSVRRVPGSGPQPHLDPARFSVERAEVRDGVELAYLREGVGGQPLLLVHGWPESKRIWWRNIEPLAAAGFEVIVPDLRGFADSGPAADGAYDLAAHARDLHGLVREVLGHASCRATGGDLGGAIIIDLGLRFPGFVEQQVLFNCPLPLIPEAYEAAGIAPAPSREVRQAADYFLRQGRDGDGLAAELDSPDKRRRYIMEFYGHRFWAAPGAFTSEEAAFMAEPFEDATGLRASFGNYESALGTVPLSETAPLLRAEPRPDRCALRTRRSRHVPRLPRALRGCLPRPHRAVRRSARRTLPAMGAFRSAERDDRRVLREPACLRRLVR